MCAKWQHQQKWTESFFVLFFCFSLFILLSSYLYKNNFHIAQVQGVAAIDFFFTPKEYALLFLLWPFFSSFSHIYLFHIWNDYTFIRGVFCRRLQMCSKQIESSLLFMDAIHSIFAMKNAEAQTWWFFVFLAFAYGSMSTANRWNGWIYQQQNMVQTNSLEEQQKNHLIRSKSYWFFFHKFMKSSI